MPLRFEEPLSFSLLNQLAQQVEDLQRENVQLKNKHSQLSMRVKEVDESTTKTFFNTILFTWNGATSKISWAAGYVKDLKGTIYQISAGSRSLTPSTGYHVAWNVPHQQMAFATDLSQIMTNKNNYLLAEITTGTVTQSGTSGGGGTDAGGTGLWRKYDPEYV